ncbi:aldehyde dehydrogenase (NAD+) [Exophiala aquamarina CBS 119918]|uniref:aldehyde dehydrogenase (NAD(+)) n=1 Tax=Exophiala aquamarina CBS 119918 TaxID=1182545 RepID=A0A072NXF6_9EURO|nr:aldehyde dehydrogenase (NAD+) [Exophiala aquamarina CBS 119918]KEF52112.1 aldehyde dehydrogenase (NAD+) [Exophiala aquamarina CBS 119918]
MAGQSGIKHPNGTFTPLDWTIFSNTIDGKQVQTAKTRHSINPANGEVGPDVPLSTPEDVQNAMIAAQKGFAIWSIVPWEERKKAVLAFANGIREEMDGFVKMLTREQGKPLTFARMELDTAASFTETVANLVLSEERYQAGDADTVVRYTPLGVCVGIVPWNFPILLACGKLAPALLTGNSIIIKPSPFTPAGGLKLIELAQRYFPAGVVQSLSGDDSLGPLLTSHPVPAKISFTGSTFTGKKVMESASKTLKRVTLELGGNDPAVVLDDININAVAPKIAQLAFLNSGQICLALKRIFVHESIFDEFRDALVKATKELKLGPGTDEGVFLGPVQNAMQYERVKGFFNDIEKEKWNVAVGGKNPEGKGYFITPTIIDRPKEGSRIVVEEPFGPIVPLLTFSNDEEAIQKANNTQYGLGASVWSSNIERANEIARKLHAGSVWVNTHFELDARVPFGGHKESGIGVEFGIGGLKSYCNSQTLYLKKA